MARWPHGTGYEGLSTEALRRCFFLYLIYNHQNEEFRTRPPLTGGLSRLPPAETQGPRLLLLRVCSYFGHFLRVNQMQLEILRLPFSQRDIFLPFGKNAVGGCSYVIAVLLQAGDREAALAVGVAGMR